MQEKTTGGTGAVRLAIAQAEPVRVDRSKAVEGGQGSTWEPGAAWLPPDCPVIPLGFDGQTNWLLDPVGQLVAYCDPYSKGKTATLFRGRVDFLTWGWPRYDKKGGVNSWENDIVAQAIINSCTLKGPWSPRDKIRGRGCWRDENGRLLMHCGNTIVRAGSRKAEPPGEIGAHVYPTRPPVQEPWPGPIDAARNPAVLLRPLLTSWSWSRPEVDPQLLLGWIGCALLGPALAWRSNIYLTGDAGMGKSTLQTLIKLVLGDWLLQTTNTTAAGIYQHVGQDGLAVAVDEFEGKDDNRHAKRVLELARQASSGGQGLRGGDRGTGSEFVIRSAFLFSSINTPPLEPQDISRFALLKLQKLPADVAEITLDPVALGIVGRTILARLLKEFHRYAETFAAFRNELAAAGMDNRGRDTFGTLLACADLIEHEGWDEERLRVPTEEGELLRWSALLDVSKMAEFEDRAENWRGCLDRMLSMPVDAWRHGQRWTVGQVLADWHAGHEDFCNDVKKVRNLLGQAGLGLARKGKNGGGDWLAVPNQNPILQRLFEGAKWFGEPGAGVWSGALRQSPAGKVHIVDDGMRVNGVKSRCTLISLEALYGRDGIMAVRDEPHHPDLI